jgi:uncharacterized radical SAM superfamily Fe-S cluster-containing enzyme
MTEADAVNDLEPQTRRMHVAGARASNERMLSATSALCNECGVLVEAQIVARDGQIWLVKWCQEHGRTEALVSSDEAWYRQSLGYVKPATPVLERCVEQRKSCPTHCGLCPGHEQHTCLPILEITEACDMACPICLVDAGKARHRTLDDIAASIETLVRCEGRFNMLTLSGGEPTMHPGFYEVLRLLDRPEIGIVSLSTNGVRLSRDDELVRRLKDQNVVVSLQFDGFSPKTWETLRGDGSLGAIKQRALERLFAAGIRVSLTTTLAKGLNEPELEGILKLLFSEDLVVSVMVQPLAHSPRARRMGFADPATALTIPDVVEWLAKTSNGVLKKTDFTPLPCSHPSCFTLTYLLKTLDGAHVPLSRVLPRDVYLDTIQNQALLNTDAETLGRARDALYELWSSSAIVPNRDGVLKTVHQLLVDLNQLGKRPSHREVLSVGVERIKSIFIHHFMDRYNFDLSRVARCCNHYPVTDGRLLPACVRNNLG